MEWCHAENNARFDTASVQLSANGTVLVICIACIFVMALVWDFVHWHVFLVPFLFDSNVVFVLKDPNQEAPEFEVPDTPFTLRVQDNLTDREVCILYSCVHVLCIILDTKYS